jgi:hypothetical protein
MFYLDFSPDSYRDAIYDLKKALFSRKRSTKIAEYAEWANCAEYLYSAIHELIKAIG